MQDEARWLRRLSSASESRLRLFCFPCAGRGISLFRGSERALAAIAEVWLVQLPGREDRIRERPLDSMSELTNQLLRILPPYLDRPFALLGHSMGSAVCFELARRLPVDLGVSPAHLFVSARRAPHVPAADPPLHRLDDPQFLWAVRNRYDAIAPALWCNVEMMSLALPLLRADFTLVETYRPDPGPVACSISAYGGRDDRSTSREDLGTWQELTRGEFRLYMLPGGHGFLEERPGLFWENIGAELAELRRS